jgi:hypothetical protein
MPWLIMRVQFPPLLYLAIAWTLDTGTILLLFYSVLEENVYNLKKKKYMAKCPKFGEADQ